MDFTRANADVSRREVLKLTGGGLAAAMVGASRLRAAETPGADLRERARKNLPLGIFSGVYGGFPLDEAARRIREDGFGRVVLQFGFKDVQFDPWNPDWDALKKMTTALEKNDIRVVGLFGYHNVIGPDEAARKRNDQLTSLLINNWQRFGSPIVSTETGTFNTKSQFEEDPRNFTEEGYAAVRKAFARLVRAAEKTKAVIAIEGYWKNVIGTAERAERLFKDIDSPSLKLTMDPCNYFRNEELPKLDAGLHDLFKRVGGQTVLAHAKDVKAREDGGQDLPAAGRGVMNYPLYLRLLTQLDREMPLVIEHLAIDDVARARDYVKAQFDKI